MFVCGSLGVLVSFKKNVGAALNFSTCAHTLAPASMLTCAVAPILEISCRSRCAVAPPVLKVRRTFKTIKTGKNLCIYQTSVYNSEILKLCCRKAGQ